LIYLKIFTENSYNKYIRISKGKFINPSSVISRLANRRMLVDRGIQFVCHCEQFNSTSDWLSMEETDLSLCG